MKAPATGPGAGSDATSSAVTRRSSLKRENARSSRARSGAVEAGNSARSISSRSTSGSTETPASRRISRPRAWNVRTRIAPAVTPSGASADPSRSVSSSAARLLNATTVIAAGSVPSSTRHATRATRVVVLPLPAGATMRIGPGGAVAAARWSGARRARRSATDGCVIRGSSAAGLTRDLSLRPPQPSEIAFPSRPGAGIVVVPGPRELRLTLGTPAATVVLPPVRCGWRRRRDVMAHPRSSPPSHSLHRRLVALASSVLVAASLVVAPTAAAAPAAPAGPPTGSCDLRSNGDKVQHVIYLQFDNVHFNRDDPNVPSDVEQMPHLYDFLKDNGTFDTNDHTVLISHTGGGILSSLTGLYPDRHGQAVSNSYDFFNPAAQPSGVGFSSTFKYWTDNTDGGNPANNPPTVSADPNYNMVNNDPAALGGSGSVRNAPAPWVPYTRAGCDVGGVGLANIELENNNAIVLRNPGATTLAAASAVGDTNVKVASVAGLAAGQRVVIETASVRAELATIDSVGTAGAVGTGVTLTAPLGTAHNSVVAFTVYTADPTGDMTKVFGEGTPEWVEARASQISPSNTAARAVAQTDFVGIAIHCGDPTKGAGICPGNDDARPDALPDEAGGYTGYKGLFGAKYVNPAINSGSPPVDDTNGGPIVDPFGHPGFPGFDGMYAKSTLGEVARMQEAGVPVTFGYISDAHDFHGVSGNTHVAYGPGEAGYVQQLKDYDQAFADFFPRLANDGITKDNSLFVVTVEEGDHFAGTGPDAPCDGVTVACTYANGHVTEANGDLRRIIAKYNADHGTNATTDFSVHSDMAPNVYIKGNPARDSSAARDLEKAMLDVNVTNPLSGVQQRLMVAAADRAEEKLLHMVTADPLRTPTFTPFAQGDYFLNASLATTCTNAATQPDLSACLFLPNTTPPAQTFAWNHGGIQPEVRSTWIGWVGPGVAVKHQTAKVWTDHTDIRPTMLALLGLKDDYVSDGRVVTEFLKGDALPKSLKAHKKTVAQLGAMWKQVNASFGQFSLDTLCASTGAL